VRDKERLKALRAEVDVLTLTATPIPRTLNMALGGLRDLSLITTPPAARLSIKTFVSEWNPPAIRDACLRELRRGGQVYFVHNSVDTIDGMAKQLAQHCELAELAESQITLRLPPAHKGLLMNKGQQDKLQAELQAYFGRPLRLDIVLAEPQGETPAARTATERRERQDRAIAAIEQDPFVREVVDLFDASIDESTIKPV
jgi:RecG-like helicase